MESIIYKVTNPNQEIYIGSTSRNFTLRKAEHKYKFKKNVQSKLCSSFLKYGFNNHKFEELIFVDEKNRIELEHFIIQEFNTKLNEVKNHNATAIGKIWVNDGVNEFQIYKDTLGTYPNIMLGRSCKSLGRYNNNNNNKT